MDPQQWGLQVGNQLQRAGDSAASYYLMFDRNRREQARQDYEISFKERAWQSEYAKIKAANETDALRQNMELQTLQKRQAALPAFAEWSNALNASRSQAITSGDPTSVRNLQIPKAILDTNDPQLIGQVWSERNAALMEAENHASNGTFEASMRTIRQKVNDFGKDDPSQAVAVINLHNQLNAIEREAKENYVRTGSYLYSPESAKTLSDMGDFLATKMGETAIRKKPEAILPKYYDSQAQADKNRSYTLGASREEASKYYDSEETTLNNNAKMLQSRIETLYKEKSQAMSPQNKTKIDADIQKAEAELVENEKKRSELGLARLEFLRQFQESATNLDAMSSAARQAIPQEFRANYAGTQASAASGGAKIADEGRIKRGILEKKYTVDQAIEKIKLKGGAPSEDLLKFFEEQKRRGF